MHILKTGIFNIRHNKILDKFENLKQNWTSKIKKRIKKNKFIAVIVIIFFSFSTLNCILIYNFMEIMKTI